MITRAGFSRHEAKAYLDGVRDAEFINKARYRGAGFSQEANYEGH